MIWPFRRNPDSLPQDQSLRLLCLRLANGELDKAVTYRDWIVDGAVSGKSGAGAKLVSIKPGPEAA